MSAGASVTLGVHTGLCHLPRELPLTSGTLRGGRLAFELTGAIGAPVVLVLGGISADRGFPTDGSRAGWGGAIVGAGAAIDTRHHAVLGVDWLGGIGASSAPDAGAAACGPRGAHGAFPTIAPRDQARAIVHLLDELGIASLHALVGASYGGMVGLALAAEHPGRVERLVAISAPAHSHPFATALRGLQRRLVRLGLECGAGAKALAIARGFAMAGYRTPEEFAERFASEWLRDTARADAWLEACGDRFVRRMTPERFLCLSESLDLHRVDPAAIEVPLAVAGARSDALVPWAQLEELAGAVRGPVVLRAIESRSGHDAFLTEREQVAAIVRLEVQR